MERLFFRLFAGAVYAIALCVAYQYGGVVAALVAAGVAIGSLNERLGEVEHP